MKDRGDGETASEAWLEVDPEAPAVRGRSERTHGVELEHESCGVDASARAGAAQISGLHLKCRAPRETLFCVLCGLCVSHVDRRRRARMPGDTVVRARGSPRRTLTCRTRLPRRSGSSSLPALLTDEPSRRSACVPCLPRMS